MTIKAQPTAQDVIQQQSDILMELDNISKRFNDVYTKPIMNAAYMRQLILDFGRVLTIAETNTRLMHSLFSQIEVGDKPPPDTN